MDRLIVLIIVILFLVIASKTVIPAAERKQKDALNKYKSRLGIYEKYFFEYVEKNKSEMSVEWYEGISKTFEAVSKAGGLERYLVLVTATRRSKGDNDFDIGLANSGIKNNYELSVKADKYAKDKMEKEFNSI